MTDPKNPFDFGTGSIDKDQWLRDIDAEQGDFVSQYSSAVNKHRAALMREAFADLRRRIANGDMLNRTADGLYQFGSALSREDKHMQEAYQRALGFMGDLARRQIQAPPAAEPEKKKYNAKTLNDRFIKYFNPSGSQESFTSLWNSYDDATRLAKLKEFLGEELNNLGNYLDIEDYASMDILKTRINDFINSPDITKLNKLGFTRNYLNLLKTEEQLEEAPKSELEQVQADIAAAQEAQQVLQGKQYLNWLKYKGNPLKWEFETKPYDYQGMFDYNRRSGNIKTSYLFLTPDFRSFSFTPFLDKSVLDTNKLREIFDKQNTELITNYLKDLGVNYSTMAGQSRLGAMLGMLQSSFAVGDKTATPYASQMSKYFTPMLNGAYYINGSANKETGRYAFYTPKQIGTYAPGIHEVSILDLNDSIARQAFGVVLSNKQGGVIEKFDEGGEISDQDWANYLNKVEPKTTKPSTLTETVPQDTNEKMDFGDIVNIAGPLALDITSMLSANGIGVGTAISAGSGIASTVWQGINDWDNNDVWGSLGSIGTNLVADGVGLIPGFGISGKVGKIAKGLAKHAKYLGLAFNAIGAHDAAQVLYKGFKTGFDLSPDEWKTLSYGLAGVAQGGAGIKRANRVNLRRGAANKRVDVTYDKNGKKHIKVTDKLESESPIGTEDTKYVATKESLIGTRGITKGNRITSAPSKRYKLMLEQPKDNIVLYPWETISKPSIDLFGAKKINKTYEESLEWLKKKKARRNSATTTETSTEASKETAKERYGGVLKALRKGGIVKADDGVKFPSLKGYATDTDWANLNFGTNTNHSYADNGFSNREAGGLGPSRGLYANGVNGDLYLDLNSARLAQYNYYTFDGGKNIFGDVLNYYNTWKTDNPNGNYQTFILDYNSKVDELRSLNKKKLNTTFNSSGWTYFNDLFHKLYLNYGKTYINKDGKEEVFDDWSDKLKDFFGESTARRVPNTFDDHEQFADLRNGLLNDKDLKSRVGIDNEGKLFMYDQSNDGVTEVSGKQKESSKVTDSEGSRKTIFNTEYKNPNDPTPYIIAGKTALGLYGNKNIYLNLSDEMPQAPLRDPIDRELATVGWQEAIKQGLNQLADLRNATWMQHGSNLLDNLAGMYETEGKGRDIMNDKFMKDSGRQFETALKSWNLDNEDTLYNIGVGDANRKAIADRARMMAQIRAAWRSGDNNILMGALSDTGNWMLKRYQREQDIIDKARELNLGTPEEWAQSEYTSRLGELANKKEADLTPADKAKIESVKAQVLREMRKKYSERYYNTFGTNLFGGGSYTTIAKDGTKLEVAKLKARSKDNDRYVSMMKDLRTTRSRRRRR